MKQKVSSIAINMRPHISKILEVPECLEAFAAFCKKALIYENLECIVEIRDFMRIPPQDYEQQMQKLRYINEKFIDELSDSGVNLPAAIRSMNLRCLMLTVDQFKDNIDNIYAALEAVNNELSIILSYRIPHFVQSEYWQKFLEQHPDLIPKCINDKDQEVWNRVRYNKQDFMRDVFTDKEVMLCELMREDQDVFRLQRTDLNGDLSVYLWDGKDLLDEEDIGMGKFQGFKVAGSLNYPPWLVLMCVASSKFHAAIWKGYRFDREYDFRYIPAQVEDNKVIHYDTHIAKLVADYGKILEYRSSYCLTENLYGNGRTYMFNKSITPHDGKYVSNTFKKDLTRDIFGEYETHDVAKNNDPYINMKGRKKCIHIPLLSMFIVQPLGDDRSLFSFINLTNPGGMLLSKIGTPEKRMMEIADSYRDSMIREIQHLLDNKGKLLKTMKSVYNMVQHRLNQYKSVSGSNIPHIMELSFEEQLSSIGLHI